MVGAFAKYPAFTWKLSGLNELIKFLSVFYKNIVIYKGIVIILSATPIFW